VTTKDFSIITTENAVFAVHLDFDKNTETVVVGESEAVQQYLGGKQTADILFSASRRIGTLIREFDPAGVVIALADIKAALASSTGRKKSPYFEQAKDTLESLYQSDNLVYRYIALVMWQEYSRALHDKSAQERIYETLDTVTLPLRFSLTDEVLEWQEVNRKNPIAYLMREYRETPISIYYDNSKYTKEYGVVHLSLLPLSVWYLKQIYKENKYLQVCPLCARPFIAKTAGMMTYCSKDCKRESIRISKKRFDDKAKDISYERASKNAYMYWYNKVRKLRNADTDPKVLAELEALFAEFNAEANTRKQAVKSGGGNPAEYENWLLMQRNVIDDFLERL
jgi:hypothetical protein